MPQKKSVQNFVKRFSLLSRNNTIDRSVQCIQAEKIDESPQSDILSQFPKEIILRIFFFVPFQDLIKVQMTCQLWCRLARDVSVWKSRYQALNSRITDIYAHNAAKLSESSLLSCQKRYCQAITLANWRTGSAQRLIEINVNDSNSRILSVKLKDNLLITLTEDNYVRLYQYTSDTGFCFKYKWYFGNPSSVCNIVERIDILPDIQILVIAQRGSKCMFYDLKKPKQDPFQVLKGGSHLLFVPDSIAVNKDYFAVTGRKPSVVFLWNWRKGIQLLSKTIDDLPHHVFLSEDNLITISSNGLLDVFSIFDYSQHPIATHRINPCSIPCIEYNSSLSIIMAPHLSKHIHHYQWDSSALESTVQTEDETNNISPIHIPLASPARKRLSSAFINLLRLKSHSKNYITKNNNNNNNNNNKSQLINKTPAESVYSRRYSDQRDNTHQKDKALINHKDKAKITPNFNKGPRLVQSIYTAPLCSAATQIISVTIHQDRMATVNREGQIALYALNGTTAAIVNINDPHQGWIEDENKYSREDDDLSDGYDFVRSRLAMGSMGLIYGGRSGSLWWLDFGCRAS